MTMPDSGPVSAAGESKMVNRGSSSTRRVHLGHVPPPFGHRGSLDGIRGLAVLAVVLFHLGLNRMSGGYLGVDVFFVLSGFLITTLLIREWAGNGRIDIRAFWGRRARRLLPAMLLVIAAVALYAIFIAQADQLDDIRRHGLASLAYVTNWVRAGEHTSYFDNFSTKSPLEHYWSLAIEEQFYVVWPLVVAGVFSWRARIGRAGRVRSLDLPLLTVAIVGTVASAGLMMALFTPENSSLYFRTDTRAQSLFVGVALAALYDALGSQLTDRKPRWIVPLGWAAGGALLLIFVTDLAPAVLYQGGFLIVALLTATVVGAAMTTPGSTLDRALAIRPLRFAGRISYGLYLWHWPVILFLTEDRTGLSVPALNVVRFAVSIGLAYASLVLLEAPVRERRMSVQLERISAGAVPLMLAVALLVTTTGAEKDFAETYAEAQRSNGPPSTVPADVPVPDSFSVLVLGDELATALPDDWDGHDGADPQSVTVTVAGMACPDPAQLCDDWQQRWTDLTAEVDPDVVIVALNDLARLDDSGLEHSFFNKSATEQAFATQLDALAVDLGGAPNSTDGRAVVFLTATASPDKAGMDAWLIDRSREAANQVAARRSGLVSQVPLESLQCGAGSCISQTPPESPNGELDLPADPTALGSALADRSHQALTSYLQRAAGTNRLRVLLLGDSVAWSIGSNFYGTGEQPDADDKILLWNRGQYACFPDNAPGNSPGELREHTNECPDWTDRWPSYVDEFSPHVVVIPVSQFMTMDRTVDGTTIPFDSPAMRRRIAGAYSQMVDGLSKRGAVVVFTTVIPNKSVAAGFGTDDIEETQRRELVLNQIIADVVSEHPDTSRLIDLAGWICDQARCKEEIDGVTLRPDGSHFSPESSPLAGRFLTDELLALNDELGLAEAE